MIGKNRKCKKFMALFLTLAISIGTLAGCQNASSSDDAKDQQSEANLPDDSANDTEEETNDENADAPDAADGTVTVTDMAGRTVTLPSEINSIATFGSIGVINAFVELMGCGDKISNQMTANFTKSDKWAMQYEFAPQIKDAPLLQNADGEIQMEEVLALNPDLCLVMSQDLIEPLESNGLNVVFFDWKKTDDVKTAVTLMGQALGREETASDYLEYFDSMVAEAQEKTAALEEKDKKTVLYGNIDTLTQPHVIAEWWIDAAGGVSETADSWDENGKNCTYTQEDVLKWNPDVMITTDAGMGDTLKEDSLYNDITAIANDAVYAIPTVAHVWGNRTVEQPLTVFWTMNKLYPDLVSDEELSEKISYFYSHFFQYKLSEEQIAKIIG